MSWRETIFGRALRSDEQESEKIGALTGVPVLGLDALASAAYGPEAALTVLLVLGAAAGRILVPIGAVIVALLLIVYVSYRQTIPAYPNGGGSYTVAKENLGDGAGLLAASALAVDYILNVAVAISAGVGAIVSAAPALLPHTLALCLGILAFLTVANLRGVRETGLLFMAPTYLFVAALGGTILWGVVKTLAAGGHPMPIVAPPPPATAAAGAAGLWLLLRAFASGCTALTGVEAVSNGIPIFREPRVREATRTLTLIVAVLGCFVAGIAFLASRYGITARPPGAEGFQSVLSMLVGAVAGRGVVYYVTMGAIVTVLCLSANTSFADFPRLAHFLALDEYLPSGFAHRGRRLVYAQGVVVLALLAGGLLVVFGGVTDRLIPLFAVGAFLAFTMSQAGMVAHWRRLRRAGGDGAGDRSTAHATRSLVINAVGATTTGVTVLVVLVSKFEEGAWITALVIPSFWLLLRAIRRHFDRVDAATEDPGPLAFGERARGTPLVVVPVKRLDRLAQQALALAVTLSPDVQAVQVRADQPGVADDLRDHWDARVGAPARAAGYTAPVLVRLASPYREVLGPVLTHVRGLAREHPGRAIAVIVPELVERRWYQLALHSHRATLLKALLLLRGGSQVLVVSAPWYLRDRDAAASGRDERSPTPPRSARGKPVVAG